MLRRLTVYGGGSGLLIVFFFFENIIETNCKAAVTSLYLIAT